MLMTKSKSRKQPRSTVRKPPVLVPLNRTSQSQELSLSNLLEKAQEDIQLALEICEKYPGQTAGMQNEVEDPEKMLRDSTFYCQLPMKIRLLCLQSMTNDFQGADYWYYCENGHPTSI